MERSLDHLYLYEIVFLFLGVILFVILCSALVFYIVKKEPIKRLLAFFPIPILMIGYPSIQEFKIDGYKLSLTKYERQLLENPDDMEVKAKLSETAENLERRAVTAADWMAVSRANLLLENSDKAIDLANTALECENKYKVEKPKKYPALNDGVSLQNNFQEIQEIKELAAIQKDIKNNNLTLEDTSQIKNRIRNVTGVDQKTRQFFAKKYLSQKK